MLTVRRKANQRPAPSNVTQNKAWDTQHLTESILSGRLSEEARRPIKTSNQGGHACISIARVLQSHTANYLQLAANREPNGKSAQYSSSNVMQCLNHSKPATHRLGREQPQFFCGRCAIGLVAEGHRLERLDLELDTLRIKLEEHMHKELDKAQQHFQRMLQILTEELKKLQGSIKQRYEQQMDAAYLFHQNPSEEVWLVSFKPPLLNQSTLQKFRDYLGKTEWKQQPFQMLLQPATEQAISRTTTSRSRLNSTRQREPSSNKKAAEIFIELCQDEVTLVDRKTFDASDDPKRQAWPCLK